MTLRFHVEPGDVPPAVAARRMGLSEAQFRDSLPLLLERKFPPPDPTTGNFDLNAIDKWRQLRYPQLFLTGPEETRDSRAILKERLERFRAHG